MFVFPFVADIELYGGRQTEVDVLPSISIAGQRVALVGRRTNSTTWNSVDPGWELT